jgi:hypothetical protein
MRPSPSALKRRGTCIPHVRCAILPRNHPADSSEAVYPLPRLPPFPETDNQHGCRGFSPESTYTIYHSFFLCQARQKRISRIFSGGYDRDSGKPQNTCHSER